MRRIPVSLSAFLNGAVAICRSFLTITFSTFVAAALLAHEFHENDHCDLGVIRLKYDSSQSLRPCCLTPTSNYTRELEAPTAMAYVLRRALFPNVLFLSVHPLEEGC